MQTSPTVPCICVAALLMAACSGSGIAPRQAPTLPGGTVPHGVWEAHEPGGIPSLGVRRNLAPGDSVSIDGISIRLLAMRGSGEVGKPDSVSVSLQSDSKAELRHVAEGTAFNWAGYHIAVLAAYTADDELGAGKAGIEIGRVAGLPDAIASSTDAGDARMRLRIPHDIRMITLHHSGSAEPLRPEDSVPEKLRALQLWSETDRNWWDVPYHFLIGLDGTIYEGRDYRYRGETNTRYDVEGHLLISVLGNYDIQESTREQIAAITEVMAWAVTTFDVALEKIYGHSDLAATTCPGTHLRKYLEDGTFIDGIRQRLAQLSREQD